MKSIIQIDNDKILIGDDSDNSIIEVRRVDCSFEPVLGDEVTVFASESKLIVTKKEKELPTYKNSESLQDKININIVNDNSRKNDFESGYMYRHVVNKWTYILLAFFLGGIGVHKFYAGRNGAGFLYLVFFWTWIPAFIALIEAIMACFKTPDAQGRILV